jgi:lipopolysaccharide export system permease protein
VKTLRRYLVKECATPFFLTYAVATFMFLIRQMRDQSDELFEAGVQLLDMARFTLLLLPVFSVYVLPIAVLLGVVFGIARLSKDSEMVAIRASGISLRQLGPPMLVLGALLSFVCFGVIEGFAPSAVVKARQLVINSILRRPAALAKPGQLMKLGPMTMKVESGDPDRGTMENVEIVFLEEDKPTLVVIAKKGAFLKSGGSVPVLRLEDGEAHVKGGPGKTLFEWANVPLDYAGISRLEALREGVDTREPETMHIHELARAASQESLSPARRIKLRNELGERCSLPFACFVFVLIGLPLAGRNVRAGRSYGLLLAFLTIIVYYVLLMVGQTLVERELANPILANWLPNIVLGSAGVVLYKRAQ